MDKKEINITRKLQVYPVGDKDQVNEIYEKIRNWQYITRKAANYISSHLYLMDQIKEMVYLKEDIKLKLADYQKDEEGILNTSYLNTTYRVLSKKYKGIIPMSSIATLSKELSSIHRKEKGEILKGERSVRSYRNDIPIKIPKQMIKSFDINKDGEYLIELADKVKLKIIFGRDKSNNQVIVDRVLEGEYKLKDSTMKWDKNKKKIFFNLVVGIPKNKRNLDENVVVGMNLGMNTPLYAATNDGIGSKIGDKEEFLYKRRQIDEAKRRLARAIKYNNGGKGRNKKLKALDRFRKKEKNFVTTKNHQYSRELINFALKNNAATINVEKFEGIARGEADWEKFILRNWSYYQLQSFIEYKAQKEGIKVVKKQPAYQSQKCSKCGHIEEENRLTREEFHCVECGYNVNADYNHAVNISRLKENEEFRFN